MTTFRYSFFWKNLIPHFTSVDQNPATGDLLHRLPDQRPEERRPEQWGGRLQGGHPQEVEREDRGAETKRTGKQLPFFIPTRDTTKRKNFMKPVFFFVGGGVEQQPRRRPSTIAHTEAKSHGLASACLGSRAQTVRLKLNLSNFEAQL